MTRAARTGGSRRTLPGTDQGDLPSRRASCCSPTGQTIDVNPDIDVAWYPDGRRVLRGRRSSRAHQLDRHLGQFHAA